MSDFSTCFERKRQGEEIADRLGEKNVAGVCTSKNVLHQQKSVYCVCSCTVLNV